MYTVYYNGSLIYDPRQNDPDYLLLDPKYSGELGKVDSFDFTILPGHPFYDTFDRLQTGIMAYRDGVPIFRGRVLSTSVNLEGEKSVQCEGDLAYLLDSLQPKLKLTGISCENLFRTVIANHNALVEPAKQFTIGDITALARADIIDVSESSFSDSRSVLDNNILKSKGGYLRTRYSNGVTYIDWVEDYRRNPDQVIHLGVNLISYEEEISADDFYTVYFPTGTYPVEDDEEPSEEGQPERDRTMTIESVNQGSKYIELTDLVQRYGKIYKAESYDGPDTPAELLADALSDISIYRNRLKRTVEIGALDLHYLDPGIDMLMVGDHVRIISEAHNKDETLVVQKVDYSFTTPEDDKYSFGDGLQTLTSKNAASDSANAVAAAKASGDAKDTSANLKLVKNRIDIEANEMNLNIKENLDITAKVLTTTFDMMRLQSTEFTYHTDEEKARFRTLKQKAEEEDYTVTNQFLMRVNPDIGQAWVQAKTNAFSKWGTINNTIGMCLDSEQGMFRWDGFRYEYEHLNDDVYDAIERMKKVGIQFNVPDTELKLFAKDEEVKSRLDGQDLVIDENTRRIGLAEITLCGDADHPGIVSKVGQYIEGKSLISLVNQTPEQYTINAQKIRLYAGGQGDGESLTSYLAAEKGKVELVVMTDENGKWVVNPASIVASINSQTGQSQVKINADKVLMTTGGKSEDLNTYISAEAGKIALVVGTDSHGNPVVNPASIVAAINDQTGESIQKINADKVIISSGGKSEELDTYISNEAGKIALVVGTDSQGNPVVNPASIVAAINDQTGESIQTINADKVVITAGGKTEALDTYIRNQLGKIELVVNTDSQGKPVVNPASIVMAINEQTGQSQIKLKADQIDMNGLVTALKTKSLTVQSLSVTGNVTSSNGSLTMPTIYLGTTESRKSLATALEDVQIVKEGTNTYRLQKKTFGVKDWQNCDVTFSRATTLARSWSGGIVTITATPQGSKLKMGIYDPKTDELTWNGNKVSFEVKTNLDDNEARYGTGKTITIDAQSIYDAGRADGSASTTIGGSWSGGILTVTSRPQGNTLKSGIFDVAVSDITWNGNKASFPLYANIDNGETRLPTGKTITIDAQSIYDKGKADGSPTTLSRTWSGGTVTVTASPQGKNLKMGIYDLRSGDITWNGNKASLKVYTNLDGNEQYYDTGKVLTVDAQAIYDKGKTDGSATTLSRSWSGGTVTVTASPQGKNLKMGIYSPTTNELTWDGNKVSFEVKTNLNGNEERYGTGKTITIDAQARYDAGYTKGKNDGKLAMGLSIDYGDGNSISVAEGSTRVAYVQAAASISYNTQTHKYTATGKAQVAPSGSGYTDMDSATATSGTEAYDAGYIKGYNDNRTADINVHTATVGPNGTVTVYARVTDYDGETTNAGEDRKCIIYGPVMKEMANCKANVSYARLGTLYYKGSDGDYYLAGPNGDRYWYYSTTSGTPVTYYRYDND